MRKEFNKSLSRIREAINTMEFVGQDCTQMRELLACLKHPRSINDKSYCTVLMLASSVCVTVSRYYEDISQMDIKLNMLQNKLYTPEIGNKITRIRQAKSKVANNAEAYRGLLDYRCALVRNICNNVPFKNRYYR